MRCFIVTKADPNRFRVLPVIEKYGWDPLFLCDTVSQRKSLVSLGVDGSAIKMSCVEKAGIQGVAIARDIMVKRYMPKDTWSIWIDDNVEKITCLPWWHTEDKLDFTKTEHDWRHLFEEEARQQHLKTYVEETIERAEEQGTIFCGFANETNFFFRGNKWQQYGYCRTQLALYKNDGSTWYPFKSCMLEDLYKSVDAVARYGSIVINRHVKPIKPMFEKGGIGSFKERLPWLKDNCEKLCEMYPGLLKLAGKGKLYGTEASNFHVTFAKRSESTINKWRKENGYAKD